MSHDEDFARTLRDRLDAVAPLIDVDTTGVVPRARRHRTRVRSLGAVAAVAVLVSGGWFADARPWNAPVVAGTAAASEAAPTSSPTTSPEPASTPSPSPSAPAAQPATWWYERWETDDGTRTTETWRSRTEYGLGVTNGDLTTADEFEPVTSIGAFRIDDVLIEELGNPALLPTDPAELLAVLRASARPGVRNGSDDDKAFDMADDLLKLTGLLPDELRRAAWEAASRLPGSTTSGDQVISGRAVDVLVHESTTGEYVRLARDPGTGLLVAITTSPGEDWAAICVEQGPATNLPEGSMTPSGE